MIISLKEMNKMHEIQYEMLKELIRVMNLLNIKYYFVHGSLLGAVRDNDFILEDDDIDIAIMRNDYNRLIKYGQELIDDKYFIQNSVTDDYPLSFAKITQYNTTFRQPVLKNCSCNQGIYIDVFPIDYESNSLVFKIKRKLLNSNISHVLNRGSTSLKTKIIYWISKIYCYSYDKALLKRELLYSRIPQSDFLCIYGGKNSEKHMPRIWFEDSKKFKFRSIEVSCPVMYREYLSRIYGNSYLSHNPAKDRFDDKGIDISADILDFERSYLDY